MLMFTSILFQACEQLNAWLGGFESMLSRMSGGNFNWFLHVMLFMHTLNMIQNQQEKGRDNRDDSEDEAENDVEDEEQQ